MNCKRGVMFLLASKERIGRSPEAQQPNSIQTVREDWGIDSKKANAKFQLGPSEISAQNRLVENGE
jgi:hypothetical protein